MAAASSRTVRGFKRWMKSNGVECSDAILLVSSDDGDSVDSSRSFSIYVKALCDLKEGDVVARIPKQSCLTVRTTAACGLIEEAQLVGNSGLAVAIMYELSLGARSKWFPYLQILPPFEDIPLLWPIKDIDYLLSGTEIHQAAREDKTLVYQDWKEYIKPLIDSASYELNSNFFTLEKYCAARSLISSRSFQIDEYHGFGMVPLADLFNHKTAAENVHLTLDSDDAEGGMESVDDSDSFWTSRNESAFMEMIVVKGVKAGTEVFNTYGSVGTAALLLRYGFSEPDNPYDIVNVDLNLVIHWSSSLLTSRQSRKRLRLWRKLKQHSNHDTDYFEISHDGEPEAELMTLLHVMSLPEKEFDDLDHDAISAAEEAVRENLVFFPGGGNEKKSKTSKKPSSSLLRQAVGKALVSLADAREDLYGWGSLDDDIRSLERCCQVSEPKLYYSLLLRISERRIIQNLRSWAKGI
ncbi:hypothetical protein M569_08865 [Genlisea aurea]|uniref:N-lysine methyltransferase n=1 Tax=Genlisea aurea TaxID=192259 RepID=S8E0Y6_9LAMI|nr:hypothetical protein M569_08865 [Genlisea aurea]